METLISEVKKTKKKGALKWWLLGTAAVLAVIVVAVAVMAFIPYKALADDAFTRYQYVNVYDRNGGSTPMLSVKNERLVAADTSTFEKEYAKLLKQGLVGTEHSMLRSAAEFNFVGDLRYITQKVKTEELVYDKDDFKKINKEGLEVTKTVKTVERVEREVVSEQALRDYMQAPGAGRFVLEFVFVEQSTYTAIHQGIDARVRAKTLLEKDADAEFAKEKALKQPYVTVKDNSTEAKKNKEQTKKLHFDRVRIVINDSQNVIQKYAMYLYDSDDLATGEAVLSPVWIRMNTTTLYGKLCELRKWARGSDDNGEYIPPDAGDEAEY
ncbi:MAG: hypothetical protein FWD58_00005 [Firmicutes bacterium]|nr:hypothetical protein [Bacillota bacterium]